MALEVKGKVIAVGKAQQVTEKLKKRTLVVEHGDNPQYLEQNQFEAINDRCNLLDELRAGDEVNVHFNLRGRSYVGKDGNKGWFNSLNIWKCDVLKTTAQKTYTPPSAQDNPDDDLPF